MTADVVSQSASVPASNAGSHTSFTSPYGDFEKIRDRRAPGARKSRTFNFLGPNDAPVMNTSVGVLPPYTLRDKIGKAFI